MAAALTRAEVVAMLTTAFTQTSADLAALAELQQPGCMFVIMANGHPLKETTDGRIAAFGARIWSTTNWATAAMYASRYRSLLSPEARDVKALTAADALNLWATESQTQLAFIAEQWGDVTMAEGSRA